jgi:hypothetical protein
MEKLLIDHLKATGYLTSGSTPPRGTRKPPSKKR